MRMGVDAGAFPSQCMLAACRHGVLSIHQKPDDPAAIFRPGQLLMNFW
jgi:hypothetical protein